MNLFNAASLPVSFCRSWADCGGVMSSIAFILAGLPLCLCTILGNLVFCLVGRQICIFLDLGEV
jgi:hypothetical protein